MSDTDPHVRKETRQSAVPFFRRLPGAKLSKTRLFQNAATIVFPIQTAIYYGKYPLFDSLSWFNPPLGVEGPLVAHEHLRIWEILGGLTR